MRFLVDTNIFLHAVNGASPHHGKARKFLENHIRNRTSWATTWPILYEFLRVSTHSRVFPKPLKPKQALAFVEQVAGAEEVALLGAADHHPAALAAAMAELTHPAGNLFHDIHTATLMLEHGVTEIVTADTDFLQFPFLKVLNPLL